MRRFGSWFLVGFVASMSLGTGAGSAGAEGKIAFTSDRDGTLEIYVMDANGENQTRVTNNFVDDWQPFWSPDGSMIAFTSAASLFGSTRSTRILDLASGSEWNLTDTNILPLGPYGGGGSWSPDGSQFVLHAGPPAIGNNEIFIVDADGMNPVRMTFSTDNDTSPQWSPDGSFIVYDSGGDIYRMKANGTEKFNLTQTSIREYDPVWSPDGTRIAFESEGNGGGVGLDIMNIDGSNRISITSSDPWRESPTWASNGNQLFFASAGDIYSIDLTENSYTNLTNTDSWESYPAAQPVMSPEPSPHLAMATALLSLAALRRRLH